MSTDMYNFVKESNKIEGIRREPTASEIAAHEHFMARGEITQRDLEELVDKLQPGAVLRARPGLDVRVGNYYPPPGGPEIVIRLTELLQDISLGFVNPWHAHCRYETLHPFTDGNGRSGRALWAWMQGPTGLGLGFLHRFYYQTLQHYPDRDRA